MPPTHSTEGLDAAQLIRAEFVETLERIAQGGSVIDPSLVRERAKLALPATEADHRRVLAVIACLESRRASPLAVSKP